MEKKMAEFKNYVFDIPKRPATPFALFVKDRIPDLKEENKDAPITKLIKMAAKEWTSEEGVSQKKYEQKALKDKSRYKKQMKEFETLGYYKKTTRGERTPKEEEDEEERTTKRKRRSKSSKKSNKRTRSKSRGKSMSKTQDVKRRSKSRKKPSTQRKK